MYSDVRSNSNQISNVVTKTHKMEIAVLEHKLNEKKIVHQDMEIF